MSLTAIVMQAAALMAMYTNGEIRPFTRARPRTGRRRSRTGESDDRDEQVGPDERPARHHPATGRALGRVGVHRTGRRGGLANWFRPLTTSSNITVAKAYAARCRGPRHRTPRDDEHRRHVGEMSATDWAISVGKPSACARSFGVRLRRYCLTILEHR